MAQEKGVTVSAWLTTTMAAVIAVAAITGGCGGSEESAPTSGSASSTFSSSADSNSGSTEGGAALLSKAEFIKQAGAACLREREGGFGRVAAYQQKHRSEGLPQAVLIKNATNAALVETVEAEIAALRALGAPAGEGQEIEALLAEVQVAVDDAKKAQGKTSNEIADRLAGADDELRAYGLARCVKGS